MAVGVRSSATRWRPERIALLLSALLIVGGLIAACFRVADGIADSRVRYHGKLDVQEVLRTFHPTGSSGLSDPMPKIRRLGDGYISAAEAEVTKPRADATVIALWSIEELAPWALGAIVLVLLVPILRAAERGDPFRAGAARRLTAIGMLLLIGIPSIVMFESLAAYTASEGRFVAPVAEPALTITLVHFLPGVLVLVLAGVFRRGAELRDFERHTI
jgi:hypothetical protein